VFITASNYAMADGLAMIDQPKIESDVLVGASVWLGANVIVLPGVTIGDGCIVGAGSVVVHSIPPNSVAVGSPARIVGTRSSAPERLPERGGRG
jgi:acetyltransferase-like isoleucine patch superfamily enzyme